MALFKRKKTDPRARQWGWDPDRTNLTGDQLWSLLTNAIYFRAVAIRKTLLADNPWLAKAVFDAFCAAKEIAIKELQVPQASKVTLPWVVAEYAATAEVMGDDIWPYGFAANRTVIEAMIRWSQNDGLLSRPLTAEELFVPAFLES